MNYIILLTINMIPRQNPNTANLKALHVQPLHYTLSPEHTTTRLSGLRDKTYTPRAQVRFPSPPTSLAFRTSTSLAL